MTPRELCLAASKRPEGVTATEMAMPRSTACMNFRKLVAAGLVFRGGGHMETRYFDNPGAASAFASRTRVSRAPAVRSNVGIIPKRIRVPIKARPGWGPDDPAHITSETKVTIAPIAPRALYSNTYPRY